MYYTSTIATPHTKVGELAGLGCTNGVLMKELPEGVVPNIGVVLILKTNEKLGDDTERRAEVN